MSTRKVISRRCCGFWEPELLAALAGLAILLGMIMPMARKANQPGWLGFLASVGIWAFGLRVFVGVDRMIGQADKSWLRLSKRLVRQLPWLGCLVPASWLLTAAIFQGPALITQRRLPELRFTKSDLGWSAKLPRTGPQLFGQNLTVEVQTRLFPDSPWILPPVSQRQADLLHRILPALPALTKRAESALIDHGGGPKPLDNPCADPAFAWIPFVTMAPIGASLSSRRTNATAAIMWSSTIWNSKKCGWEVALRRQSRSGLAAHSSRARSTA